MRVNTIISLRDYCNDLQDILCFLSTIGVFSVHTQTHTHTPSLSLSHLYISYVFSFISFRPYRWLDDAGCCPNHAVCIQMRTATQRVGHHHYRYGTPVSAEEERERKKRTSRNVIQEKENNLTKAPLTAFVMAAADRREKREADGRDHRIWVGEGEWLIRHILVNAPISRSPGPMPIHLFYFFGGVLFRRIFDFFYLFFFMPWSAIRFLVCSTASPP